MNRRKFPNPAGGLPGYTVMVKGSVGLFALWSALLLLPAETRAASGVGEPQSPIRIGSRLELLVDDYLVERLQGTAEWRLHQPQPQEIVMRHEEPWEGSGSGYHNIFQAGGRYRMYYKAYRPAPAAAAEDPGRREPSKSKDAAPVYPRFCCYAESDDGIHWRKPVLGLHEFNGSKANNIVFLSGRLGALNVDAAHAAVFKDENPAVAPDAQYKAVIRSSEPPGLLAFKSADGVHWAPMSERPVITAGVNFDSQNLAFWDSERKEYRAYWRIYPEGISAEEMKKPEGKRILRHRAIRTATSPDFINWSEPQDLSYGDAPVEDLYTNQIKSYYRAPHLYIGFPTRYLDRGPSEAMRALPEQDARQQRSKMAARLGTAMTEGLFMSSRDGVKFKRWNEAFLRPGIERAGTWNYGHQYLAWHVVPTKSALAGAPDELSLYATERYWDKDGSVLRRYTLRMDGFVSVRARMSGGELLSKPLIFSGRRLQINFSSSAAGGIRVELQDESGAPLPGFSLGDSEVVFGDAIERVVTWKSGGDLGVFAGKPIRVRFVLNDADLYSLRFVP